MAEWWHNTGAHSSTGMSPFKAMYGTAPPRLLSYVRGTTQAPAVEDYLRSRDQIMRVLKENLEDARQRIKKQADLHRTERNFNEGD